MDSNVFIASADSENFTRTVRSAVDLSDRQDRPEELAGMDSVRFWGAGDGTSTQNHFENMESGDLVLFYRDGEYVGTGRVGTTFEDDDRWASETFWEGDSTAHIYTITEFETVSVSKAKVNRIFDYNDGYTPPELLRIADKRVTNSPEAIELALQRYTERQN